MRWGYADSAVDANMDGAREGVGLGAGLAAQPVPAGVKHGLPRRVHAHHALEGPLGAYEASQRGEGHTGPGTP